MGGYLSGFNGTDNRLYWGRDDTRHGMMPGSSMVLRWLEYVIMTRPSFRAKFMASMRRSRPSHVNLANKPVLNQKSANPPVRLRVMA
jgi:hypothetical protein